VFKTNIYSRIMESLSFDLFDFVQRYTHDPNKKFNANTDEYLHYLLRYNQFSIRWCLLYHEDVVERALAYFKNKFVPGMSVDKNTKSITFSNVPSIFHGIASVYQVISTIGFKHEANHFYANFDAFSEFCLAESFKQLSVIQDIR